MVVRRLRLRDFRTYASADVALGAGLTVVHGRNGAGKTNLLEALYFGCTGRSCRTNDERQIVRFDQGAARVEVDVEGRDGPHQLAVGFQAGEPKRIRVDGVPVEALASHPSRPLVSVFLPDRLELIKGAPSLRRAHLGQLVAALWPARAANRRAYSQALAQRNALIGRIRSGRGDRASLVAWDQQLARYGVELMRDRSNALDALHDTFGALSSDLGLDGEAEVVYRPRSRAGDAQTLVAELGVRIDADLERGFTGHGPHRDDLSVLREGREL